MHKREGSLTEGNEANRYMQTHTHSHHTVHSEGGDLVMVREVKSEGCGCYGYEGGIL